MNPIPSRRDFLKIAGLGTLVELTFSGCTTQMNATTETGKRPNIVVIFLDDSGWADFKPFGKPSYDTPNVKQLAAEGCCFHNFHVPQAVCSASRGALLTGCYPERTKLVGAHGPRVRGMDPKWATIAQVLKTTGYQTAVFGKWHIGDETDTRPPARGFDESCGLMYSNDMWRFHPGTRGFDKFPLQFWENGKITIEDVSREHQEHLTTWYTEHAVDFIKRKKDKPFFLYIPHSMPHVPIFCSSKFRGKSGTGLYGDVMMEIDWSVGQIMNTLKKAGVEDNTLVIFSSDNGPWISYGNHAGKTPYREAKGTGFDGGTRSACIMKYPGKIIPGTVSQKMICTIDILPTLAHLAGARLPENPIDGKNLWDLITGRGDTTNPHEYYAFSTGNTFEGLFSGDGRWKLHVPHQYRSLVKAGNDGQPGIYEQKRIGLSLFDMENDPLETTNVIDKYPEITSRLQVLANKHREKFYDASKH
ncbi:MAG: sulfatase [Kiritimatiellae bacterium]|nr:sulfatase [Kiritimatiellia bacterium]MDD5519377.1 sulfatase [Kiritimatiellia bacterium]